MSVLGDVLNDLGQTILPNVAAIVFPDTMTIYANNTEQQADGTMREYLGELASGIPVSYKPLSTGYRATKEDKQISVNEYELTFPVYFDGARLDFDPKTARLSVAVRGFEPVKTFRVKSVQDVSGVVYKVICTREN